MDRNFEDRIFETVTNHQSYQVGYWKGISSMLVIPAIIGITWTGLTIGRLIERYSKRSKKEQDE